jgi:dolichyl-phosphate-mannose--protein O-mannosyl transferase
LPARPPWFIIGRTGKSSCLRGQLSSNVRPHSQHYLMPPANRLSIAVKGAILWVLLSCTLGLLPWLVVPSESTSSIAWATAAFGVIGAASHLLVIAVKSEPFHLRTSVATVALLCCTFFLVLVYWISGTPSEPLRELFRILAFVALPAVVISYSVLRVLRWQGAA